MKNNKKQKGFTLIELLVVIAIIAILAVVVILTLNPAELLRQARDSNRVSDFATLKSALSLYATDVTTATTMYGYNSAGTVGIGGIFTLYTGNSGGLLIASSAISQFTTTSTLNQWGFLGGETGANIASTTSRVITGAGWIPVNLAAISSGAPIAVLPVDPVNNGQLMYVYAASTTVFKLASKMESLKYGNSGSNDVVSNDGGNSTTTYEQGTNLSL